MSSEISPGKALSFEAFLELLSYNLYLQIFAP